MYKIVSTFLFFFCFGNSMLAQKQVSFGNQGSEAFKDVVFLEDGSFAVTGVSRANGSGSDDMSLHFYKADGRKISCHYFGHSLSDIANGIAKTKSGDILMVGQGYENPKKKLKKILIYRIDKDGNVIWEKSFWGKAGYKIKEFESGKIGVLGYHKVKGRRVEYLFILLDEKGNKIFDKTYGSEFKDYGFGMIQTQDKGYLLAGIKGGFHSPEGHSYLLPNTDILFVKTDKDGNELWQKEFGDKGHDFISDMEIDRHGNIYLVGSTQGNGEQSFDAFLMKIDEEANVIWQQNTGGKDFEYGQDLVIDKHGDLIICGTSNSYNSNDNPDIFIAKYNKKGEQLWLQHKSSEGSEYANGIDINAKGECIVVGSSEQNKEKQYLFVKLNAAGHFQSLSKAHPSSLFSPMSNPKKNYLFLNNHNICQSFSYAVYDINGIKIKEAFAKINQTKLDLGSLAVGLYIIQITLEDGSRIVKQVVKNAD